MLVAYPSRDLVAEIDLASHAYVRGLYVRPGGVLEDAGPSPSCPVECADQSTAKGPPAAPATRPDALTLRLDSTTKQLYVGAASSRFLYAADFNIATGEFTKLGAVELSSCPRRLGSIGTTIP